jgi:uncharacterized protein
MREGLDPAEILGDRGAGAALEVVRRVRLALRPELLLAALFGSRARGEARPDSDVDILLVFDRLAPDREPEATLAEEIAAEVAAERGIPVTVWSISVADLSEGCRTPMLVDALDDAIPLWPEGAAVPRVRFTPADALFCAECLLDRVDEGSAEVARLRLEGRSRAAWRRTRDDLVRLCTALLLLEGHTRPRRAAAVRVLRRLRPVLGDDPVLRWAERAFRRETPPPPGVAETVRRLKDMAVEAMHGLARGAGLAS